MKKPNTKPQTPSAFTNIASFVKQHALVLSIALFACLAGYILFLTSQLTQMQPDQTSIDAELSGVARPSIDESVVNTITNLEDRNIEIKSIFEEARDNPFSE